ncbi:hypothetical protein [Streptomyces afghaniensis]|nr:hypothetical protein [Streptomyces afghaniensis]
MEEEFEELCETAQVLLDPQRAPSPTKSANDWSKSAQRCSSWIE